MEGGNGAGSTERTETMQRKEKKIFLINGHLQTYKIITSVEQK